MNILIAFYFTLLHFIYVKSEPDYYWRDYNGVVPEDALPAGKDLDGGDTYIGQAYMHGRGLFVAQLTPGTTAVAVPCYGSRKVDSIIKILCTRNKNHFSWLSTTSTRFHLDTINKHVVIGGYDHVGNKGIINIGRIMHQGILKIGQLASYKVERVLFYFAHKNRMESATLFEALIYNPDSDSSERYSVNPRIELD